MPSLEFAEEGSREVLRLAGDTDKREALLRQKVLDALHACHIGFYLCL